MVEGMASEGLRETLTFLSTWWGFPNPSEGSWPKHLHFLTQETVRSRFKEESSAPADMLNARCRVASQVSECEAEGSGGPRRCGQLCKCCRQLGEDAVRELGFGSGLMWGGLLEKSGFHGAVGKHLPGTDSGGNGEEKLEPPNMGNSAGTSKENNGAALGREFGGKRSLGDFSKMEVKSFLWADENAH